MSLKRGWAVSALALACLAGASRADEPTWAVVTAEPTAAEPVYGLPWEDGGAGCGHVLGGFGAWASANKGDCGGGKNGLHLKPGCGKKTCGPCLPEGYGYNETCWRPWTAPRRRPPCSTAEHSSPVRLPPMPAAELAPPAPGAAVPDEKAPPPKKAPEPSPYR